LNVAERGGQLRLEQRPRDGGQDARTVGGARAVAGRAAVGEAGQRIEAARQPLVARASLAIHDETDAARIVFPSRRIEHWRLLSRTVMQKENRTST
jgi:hypothetical protein